jgi:hypothetical protein
VSEMGGQRTRLSMLSRSHSKKYGFKKKTRKVYCTRTEHTIASATRSRRGLWLGGSSGTQEAQASLRAALRARVVAQPGLAQFWAA